MQDNRFEVVYEEHAKKLGAQTTMIYVDRQTGVNYLFIQSGAGGGLKPLFDAAGKPMITK